MNEGNNTAKAMASLIAERVEALGLSQRQFADLVNCSTKHVNRVFNGRVTALANTLDEWAAILGIDFEVSVQQREVKS